MKFLLTHKNTITAGIFFITLFILVSTLQYKYDEIMRPKASSMLTIETKYVMPASVTKNLAFGFNNVLADFYWVSLIQNFSLWNGKDSFYLEQYKNISVLDPNFSYPYLLGILTFTARGINYKESPLLYRADIETFEPIANIGMENMPDNWEIPFYLGTAFQLAKMPDRALPYLKIASEKETAPEFVKNAYQTYLKNILSGTEASTALIKTIYDTTTSETTKKIVEESLLANALSTALTLLAHDYKKMFGKFPKTLDDIIAKKMINPSAEIRRDYIVTINQTTGEVIVTSKASIEY